MTNNELATEPKMEEDDYKKGLSSEEMQAYLTQYPSKANMVFSTCPEHRLLALGANYQVLQSVRKTEQTLEEVLAAVSHDGRAIQFASKRLLKKNPELYEVAVKSNGLALPYVPDKYRYEGIYQDAVCSNGSAIQFVPETLMTEDIIMAAVRSDGMALSYIPRARITKAIACAAFATNVQAIRFIPARFRDISMAIAAVTSNGRLLEFVPQRLLTTEVCIAAVRSDPLALKFVPFELIDEEIAICAVKADWKAIRYVIRPTRTVFELAFEQSALAIEYCPSGMMTHELCISAFVREPGVFRFIPKEYVSVEVLRHWLLSFFDEQGKRIDVPSCDEMLRLIDFKDLLSDPIVASLMRRMGKRETRNARWVKKSGIFYVVESVKCGMLPQLRDVVKTEELSFIVKTRLKGLDELYRFFDGDLSQVEFKSYPFDDYDAGKHDLSTAHLPVRTLRRLGAYDDSAYQRLVSVRDKVPMVRNPELDETLAPATMKDAVVPLGFNTETPFYYVSDLHLDYKLKKRFPKEATDLQIRDYISNFVREMVETATESGYNSTLLVLGDTSYNINVVKLFFKALRRVWNGDIYCVLGNHELWDWSEQEPLGGCAPTVNTVVDKYRDALSDLRVTLLQNDLFMLYRGYIPYQHSERQLANLCDDELKDYLNHSRYVLLGGIGFSGLCDSFNAEHGLYQGTVTSRERDIALSEEFSSLHERVRRLAPRANVIVATHMPMSNWSAEKYQPGWVYVNGHTHRNTFIESGGIRAYADNQIGYVSQSAGLARFYVEGLYDPFRHLPDGIHEVHRTDYTDFYRQQHIWMNPMKRKGRILMLKRESVFLFLLEAEDTGRIYLLKGGQWNSLDDQNPEYYYEHMLSYAHLVRQAFSMYMTAINTIGEEVRSFGGRGKVHGCIVDIDFYNHIYLDPHTGELSFYYASSVTDRWDYPSLEELLAERVPRLLPAYKAVLESLTSGGELIVAHGIDPVSRDVIHRTDTTMYRASNVVYSVQRLFESNVIRVWNESVLGYVQEESKELAPETDSKNSPSRLTGPSNYAP